MHNVSSRAGTSALAATIAVLSVYVGGCGGHAARTLKMRTALDQGQPRAAISALNEELDVKTDRDMPAKVIGDDALLVLDRATIQQSLAQFDASKRDFSEADKAIDMLDLAHNAGDSIGQYVFSDSAGKYVAPPYEKLLINTLNLMNYLETGDLSGAKVEARRLTVMQRYITESLKEKDNAVVGLGGFLAGYTYEKSGDIDEALRYYDDALAFSGYNSLKDPVRALASQGTYSSPRLKTLVGEGAAPAKDDEGGEIVFVVGYGRVPHKIPQRIPIGLALTLVSADMHPGDVTAANKLATQGLVTWINFPTLAPETGQYEIPSCKLDNNFVQLEEAVDVSRQVRSEWKKIEGKIIISAITRLIARLAVGEGIQQASGKGSIAGFVASLAVQGTLSALDTPDTRSWETLPARIAIARVRVPAGKHAVHIDARGVSRKQEVNVAKGGWAVVSLMALR